MNGKAANITFVQVFMILALMNGLASHVIVNPMVLEASGRDSWIAVLAAGAIYLAWIMMLHWLMKRTEQRNWKEWLRTQASPALAWLLIAPVCVQLYMIGGMTIEHTVTWHITNYLPETPRLSLVLFLVCICTILALWGLRVIANVSGILLPIVVGLGIFVSAFNSPMKDYALLRPMLEHGWEPVWSGIMFAGAGFVELALLVVMQHHLKTKVKAWQLLLYGLFSIIISLGPIVGAITEFGPAEAAYQMTSPYEQWRLVQIGQFIEHLDFLSIFQWHSGACIRISLSVYLLVELLSIRLPRYRYVVILAVMASYLLLCMVSINEYSFYLWMSRYYMPISLTVLLSLSLLWMLAALIRGKEKRTPAKEGSA